MEDDTTTVDDAAADADFGAGFESKETPPAKEKPEPATDARAKEEPAPEYAQLTKSELAELKAAASKTASYDQQLSKAFGTIGNLQKVINELQTNKKAELSSGAFTKLKEQFPELAEMTKEAVENALSGRPNAEADEARIERLVAQRAVEREVEALEDAHPDWRTIVGAVDTAQAQPDPQNPFRKWLATKDATYQARVNGTVSAAILTRAISIFQKETAKPAQRPNPRADSRREQIAAAVQPRGDGAPAASRKSEDDEFIAGFNSG